MNATETNYNQLAKEVIEEFNKLTDFSYHGELPLGETWGITFSRHRDSDVLENSNFEVISDDLMEKFPDDCQVENFNHWAVGWVDNLCVKMIDDKGNCTEAGKLAFGWKENLENYPIACEMHFSEKEREDFLETLENCYIPNDLRDNLPDDYINQIAEKLFEVNSVSISDGLDVEMVETACKELDFYSADEMVDFIEDIKKETAEIERLITLGDPYQKTLQSLIDEVRIFCLNKWR